MRLRVLVIGTILAACPIFALSASGAPARPVSGTMAGPAPDVAAFCSNGAFSVSGSFDATFIGSGTYTGTITSSSCIPPETLACCGIPSSPYSVEGTFTFVGPGGSFTASGSGTGRTSIAPHFDNYEIELSLTIQSGTRRYRRAAGSLDLNLGATTFPGFGPGSASGTISGSISPTAGVG